MSWAISSAERSAPPGSFALCRLFNYPLVRFSTCDRSPFHFWTTDRSLSVFLWLLLIAVFILAPLTDREGMLFAAPGFPFSSSPACCLSQRSG